MPKSAYSQIFSSSRLKQAWTEMWKSSSRYSAPGVDGLTPAEFDKNSDGYLESLGQKLRGDYVFSSLRPFAVPKSNGKERLICVPTVADRLVQRVIVAHLMSRPGATRLLNEVSFGFLKTRGVVAARDRAIELRLSHGWAYKSDISSFQQGGLLRSLYRCSYYVLLAMRATPGVPDQEIPD